MLRLSFAAAVIVATAAPAAAQDREPTEAQMRQALENRLSAASESMRSQGRNACDSVDGGSQNPIDAIVCLIRHPAIVEQAAVTISYFEKVACAKAPTAGFRCDYLVRANAPALGALNATSGTAEMGSKRFVRTRDGWVAFDE